MLSLTASVTLRDVPQDHHTGPSPYIPQLSLQENADEQLAGMEEIDLLGGLTNGMTTLLRDHCLN